MKNLKFFFLLCIAVNFHLSLNAQKGISCDSAKVLSYPVTNSVTSYTNSVYWFKVTLDSGNYSLKVANIAGPGKIYKAIVYTGTCSSLTEVKQDTLAAPTNTVFNITFNPTVNGTVYYVKLFNTGGSVSFNKTMATEIHIVGQIGYCPGQQVTLEAYPVNPVGAQTYTWLPGNIHTQNINVTPSGTTTYTLIHTDAAGTLSTSINVFPLGPDQCKNCELVQNGHFEWYNTPIQAGANITDTDFWIDPTQGSSDYYSANSLNFSSSVPTNFYTNNTPAHSGIAYAGLYTMVPNPITPSDHREYIQSPLSCAMAHGQVYDVSFFTYLADNFHLATNIGAHLSTTAISNFSAYLLTNTPQVSTTGVTAHAWTQVQGSVTGNGEQFITVGNFLNDVSTNSVTVSGGPYAGAYYFIDDVSVTPIPPTLSAVCNGTLTTLSASGAATNFTSWTNGLTVLTGTTVTIPTPTANTTYSCIVSLPCPNCTPITQTISVTGVPVTASTSHSVICSGSVTLTTSGASSYTWQPGGSNSNPLVVSPGGTTIYTVTGANGSGCASTATVMVTVNSNLCCQTPSLTFTTGYISAQTAATGFGAILIEVNGTLTIDVPNFVFTGTNIRMTPNSKLIIAPSCTVTLTSAHLFSCNYMWEGIELSNNSRLNSGRINIVSPNASIDDARIAIYCNATSMATPPTISLNFMTLSKNFVGVKLENYNGSAAYPFGMGAVTIQGNVATSYSPGTTLKAYLSGGSPVYYASTQYGVNLVNVNAAVVGSYTGSRNSIKALQYGVRLVNTNAHVVRNDFTDLSSTVANRAVWATGNTATSPAVGLPNNAGYGTKRRFVVGGSAGSGNHCTFRNMVCGVYADSCMTNYILGNTFRDVTTRGIEVRRSNYFRGYQWDATTIAFSDKDTSYIYNNLMQNSGSGTNLLQNGVGYFDNTYFITIASTNTLTLKRAASTNGEGVGIYHGAGNIFAEYYVYTNTINGGGNYGINQMNTINPLKSINNNTITVANGSGLPNPSISMGISSQNSPYATIKENSIDETGVGSPTLLYGIYINNGQADEIGCNLIKNTTWSSWVNLNNLGSTYKGNVMNGANTGLYLQNGTMGNIGGTGNAAQNEWYSTTWNTFVSNTGATPSNIFYDNSISARNPAANGSSAAFPFVPSLTTVGTLGCTQSHRMMNGNEPAEDHSKDSAAIAFINGSNTFARYNEGLQWEHRNGILNMLKDSLLDNSQPALAQFRQQQSNVNLGKINALMRALGNYADVQQNKNTYMQQLNSIGTVTNTVDQNYTLFLKEYITQVVGVANISQSTYSNMKNLAQKCPYSDGAVVYNARALMKIWGDETAYVNNCELPQIVEAGEQSKTQRLASVAKTEEVLVYPNPNNGNFNVLYSFEKSVKSFELYDIMGKKVMDKQLAENKAQLIINAQDLINGIYMYKITGIDGSLLHNGKLIINK